MDILLLLIPITLFLLTLGGVLFWWTVRSGQYDDLDSPAQRILFDDDDDMIPPNQHRHRQITENPTQKDSHDVR